MARCYSCVYRQTCGGAMGGADCTGRRTAAQRKREQKQTGAESGRTAWAATLADYRGGVSVWHATTPQDSEQ